MTKAVIRVNGTDEEVDVHSLLGLLESKGFDAAAKGVAVALNGRVVPRGLWGDTPVKAQDDVEIVRARQGG
jgi:sulfur carrier protein